MLKVYNYAKMYSSLTSSFLSTHLSLMSSLFAILWTVEVLLLLLSLWLCSFEHNLDGTRSGFCSILSWSLLLNCGFDDVGTYMFTVLEFASVFGRALVTIVAISGTLVEVGFEALFIFLLLSLLLLLESCELCFSGGMLSFAMFLSAFGSFKAILNLFGFLWLVKTFALF